MFFLLWWTVKLLKQLVFINLPNQAKPEKNRVKLKNRAKPKYQAKLVWTGFVQKNRTKPKPVGLNRFRFVFILKNFDLIIFFW
jgi:hypothetical protein